MPSPPRPPRSWPRPIDYVAGSWPDGRVRPPAGASEMETYAAQQVVRLVRDIVDRRRQRGLRPSQVAAFTGLRPNTLSDLENGHTWPDLRTLSALAWVLDADIEFVPRASHRRRMHDPDVD